MNKCLYYTIPLNCTINKSLCFSTFSNNILINNFISIIFNM